MLDLRLLNIGLARLQISEWDWQDVQSPFTRLYCVTRGTARVIFGSSTAPTRTMTLTPGQLYIIPAYTLHSYESSEPFDHYYIHFYEETKDHPQLIDLYDLPDSVPATELDVQLFEQLCRDYPQAALPTGGNPTDYDTAEGFSQRIQNFSQLSFGQQLQQQGITTTLLSRFLQVAHKKLWTEDRRLMRALEYAHAHIREDIEVKALADIACLTVPSFIRLFRRELNISPLQYINRRRIERAQLLLTTTQLQVQEVAYHLGFNDSSYFSRLFKKQIGLTPNEYRLSGKR